MDFVAILLLRCTVEQVLEEKMSTKSTCPVDMILVAL